MKPASFDRIREVFSLKNYKFYTTGLYNLNLIAVRSNESESDKFDDHFHVIYRGEDDRFKHHTFACTTDPGKYWLQTFMNPKGTAIMVPGQYRSAYKKGQHKGYDALVQHKPIWFVRDKNKDTKLDFDLYRDKDLLKKHGEFQVIAANIHRASQWNVLPFIGRYSAACQVIQGPKDFALLMSLVDKQIANGHGIYCTYTLLEESDL